MNNTAISLNEALKLQAQDLPDKIFITHRDTSYTYAQTYDLVNRLAGFLKHSGITPETPVCLMLPRVPELIMAFLAATRIKAYPIPVNYLLCADDITQFIEHISPKVIITSDRLLSTENNACLAKTNACLSESQVPLRIDIDNRKKHWTPWNAAIDAEPYQGEDIILPDDVAYLNFTTGTSGAPKGALATHANIYWNTRSAVEALSMNNDDIHLCMFASFAHPHELFARALYTGASLTLLEEINPKTIIRTINKHSVTCMMGLAPMYEMMANHCGSMTIPSLKIAESGGMFTRPAINETFQKYFEVPILSVWGSTETTGVTLANTPEKYRTDGSMGRICPYYQVKLVDDKNREVARGEIGELHFKGPAIVSGYQGGPPLLDDDGWYASGDMATMDKDGFFYFVERKSGMIKVAGLKVYPLQLELLLLEHPRIAEVAVLGVPDQRKGYIPKAFIVTRDNSDFDYDDMLTFCKGKIPSYMIPKQVVLLKELPKIGSGKINKKALAEPQPFG